MGLFVSKIMGLFDSFNKEQRLLMLGLDAAGKTTVVYKLKLDEMVHTIPTIGFNVETIQYKKLKFTIWDVGGQEKIRPLWRYYYGGTNALVWVVDSADRARLEETREELARLLREDDLRDAAVLVFANKQDLPNAMGVKELAQELNLENQRGRHWHVQATQATTGDGLYEGLDWLANTLRTIEKEARH